MTREFSDELLSAYLDDQLSAAERAEVEAHLAASPAARQLLDELRAVSHEVQTLPGHKADGDFANRVVRAALAAQGQQSPPAAPATPELVMRGSLRRRTRVSVIIGTVVATAAALAILIAQPFRQGPNTDPEHAAAGPGELSPIEQALASLQKQLPGSDEAIIVRVRVPAGVNPSQAVDLALASAGISQLSPADVSSGAIEVGAAYRKQLGAKFAVQPGVPNPALDAETTTAVDAIFIEATWEHVAAALTELVAATEQPLDLSPLMHVAAAKPAAQGHTGAEAEGGTKTNPATGAAPQEFAQRLPARMYRIEKSPATASGASAPATPIDAKQTVRVLVLIETM